MMARILKRFTACWGVLFALILASGPRAWSVHLMRQGAGVERPKFETLDDRLARLAEEIPGFGGIFLEEDGELSVYLVGGEAATQSVEEIGATIARALDWEEFRLGAKGIRILPGQYDFRQLKEWHDRLFPHIFDIGGVILTDIDEARNRLRIGVENESAAEVVIQTLISLSVPREAVIVEIVEPILPMATLQDRVRPLVGGVQIQIQSGGGGFCTLGFNAIRSGVTGFVTASHCTNVQGGVEGTLYWQPREATDTFIGTEIADPPYTQQPSCPTGIRCRYSDSAFVQFASGVSSSLGYLARTSGLGSFTITGGFRIVAGATMRVPGEIVNKVGRATGWSQGPIVYTCVNLPVYREGVDTGLTLLCQDVVQATSQRGDSGSPVFRITNGSDVILYGLLWGGDGTRFFVYSPIENIQHELGPLRILSTPTSDGVPAVPTGLSPGSDKPDGSVRITAAPITLRWNTSSGANQYEVIVFYWSWATSKWVYHNTYTTVTNSLSYSLPVNSTHYAWAVRAGNASGWSDWSSPAFFYFHSSGVPAVPTGLSPGSDKPDGAVRITTMPITLRWDPSPGADWYLVIVVHWSWSVQQWVSRVFVTQRNWLDYWPPENNTLYAWAVRAGNASGWSDWSNGVYFYFQR